MYFHAWFNLINSLVYKNRPQLIYDVTHVRKYWFLRQRRRYSSSFATVGTSSQFCGLWVRRLTKLVTVRACFIIVTFGMLIRKRFILRKKMREGLIFLRSVQYGKRPNFTILWRRAILISLSLKLLSILTFQKRSLVKKEFFSYFFVALCFPPHVWENILSPFRFPILLVQVRYYYFYRTMHFFFIRELKSRVATVWLISVSFFTFFHDFLVTVLILSSCTKTYFRTFLKSVGLVKSEVVYQSDYPSKNGFSKLVAVVNQKDKTLLSKILRKIFHTESRTMFTAKKHFKKIPIMSS